MKKQHVSGLVAMASMVALAAICFDGGVALAKKKKNAKAKAEPVAAAAASPDAGAPAEPEPVVEADLAEPDKHCKKEMASVCMGVPHGDNRVAACLRKNKDTLTPGCAQALNKYQMGRFMHACKGDMNKHCKAESTQKGALFPCMQKNADKLTDACQDVMGLKPAAAAMPATPAPAAK